jgi:hypothetical protein
MNSKALFERHVKQHAAQLLSEAGSAANCPDYECDDESLYQSCAVYDAPTFRPKNPSDQIRSFTDTRPETAYKMRVNDQGERLAAHALEAYNRHHRRFARMSEIERPEKEEDLSGKTYDQGGFQSVMWRRWQSSVAISS